MVFKWVSYSSRKLDEVRNECQAVSNYAKSEGLFERFDILC